MPAVGGRAAQLRLNQPTWLLNTPHHNPLRGLGAMGATALPLGRRPRRHPAPRALGEAAPRVGWRLGDVPTVAGDCVRVFRLCQSRGGRESVGAARPPAAQLGCFQGRCQARAEESAGAS